MLQEGCAWALACAFLYPSMAATIESMSVAIFVFAVLAVLAAWLPIGRYGRLGLAGVVGVAGFGLGVIGWAGLAALLVLLLLAWRLQPDERAVSGLVFALLALALGFGLLPGFAQVVVFGPEAIKPGSEAYVRGVSLGLVAITLLLLAMHPLADRWASAVRAIRLGVGVGLLTAMPALGAGYLLGDLAFAPGLPGAAFILTWLGGQVLTLAMEEGFFRGFLQRHLARHVPVAVAIVLAGVLFGLAHFAGGLSWIIGASIAGVGYGIAYHLGGARLEASMAAHLTVNLLHLSLFSYPMLAGIAA